MTSSGQDTANGKKNITPASGRERGTTCYNKTSWRFFLLQVVLVLWLVFSAAGCYLCYYSILRSIRASAVAMQLFVQVAFGFGTVMTGILYQSPAVFSLTFGVACFVSSLIALLDSTDADAVSMLVSCTKIAAPCMLTALLLILCPKTIMAPVTGMLDRFASIGMTCFTVYALAFSTSSVGGLALWTSGEESMPFATMPSSILNLAVMILAGLYHTHRSHKHGSLLTATDRGGFVLTGVAMIASSVLSTSIPQQGTGGLPLLLPQLMGCLLSVLLWVFFAAVADVWYPVGTGQFHMVAVDTFCLFFYFVAPLVFLAFRLVARHGDAMQDALLPLAQQANSWLSSSSFLSLAEYKDLDTVTTGLLVSCVMGTMLGLVMVCNLCPVVGHLLSWVYTHGQPQTKKVALCLRFEALLTLDGNKEELWKCLETPANEKKQTLNIFVTLDDLKQHAKEIKQLLAMGHYLGVGVLPRPKSHPSWPFWPLAWQESAMAVCQVHEAFHKVTGQAPLWFHPSRGGGGNHPAALWTAATLGMQVAYWSTVLVEWSDKERWELRHDLQTWRGGNLVLIESTRVTPSLLQDLLHVVKSSSSLLLEVASLPLVVKDQKPMELPKEESHK